ncbi:MAG: hypothetical protein IJ874_06240 [Ruminococcus sp.]|nr:hypothetical protein [Ruminococcus sp.]
MTDRINDNIPDEQLTENGDHLNENAAQAEESVLLEEILSEYAPEDEDIAHVDREDAQRIAEEALDAETNGDKPSSDSRAPVSHERNPLFDEEPEETAEDEVDDIRKPVSKKVVVSTEGITETDISPESSAAGEDTDSGDGSAPKIRRMAESTRAREARQQKKRRRKHRKKGADYTYRQEAAVGEYADEPPKGKRKRSSSPAESMQPDEITDIVPAPADPSELEEPPVTKPKMTPRAEMTSIDLSGGSGITEADMDVSIDQPPEQTDDKVPGDSGQTEHIRRRKKAPRTKRLVDFNYYGAVEDVGRDIRDLSSIISTRVVALALASFLSIYISLCTVFDLPITGLLTLDHIYIFMAVQLGLGIISALISLPVITKGVKNLFTMKADSDSMTAIAALTCILSMIPAYMRPELAQQELIRIYMPVGILSLLTNAMGKLLIVIRAQRNFRFVSKEYDRHAVVYVRDEERAERLTRGASGDLPILAAMRRTNFITDFLRYSYSSDITDSYCRKAAPITLIVSLVISLVLTFLRTGTLLSSGAFEFCISLFSLLICSSACVAMPFVVNIPLEGASAAALGSKGIILGYQSVDDLYDVNSMLITADKLFPAGTVRLEDIKLFANSKLNDVLISAASLAKRSGSIMQQIFPEPDPEKDAERLYDIENYSYEDGFGICGWINNKRILLGSRDHMTNHSIEGIPSKSKEAEYAGSGRIPLYLSISGNVAALYIVSLRPDRYVKRWARRLSRNHISIVVKSVDPCLTPASISSLMDIPEDGVRVLPKRLHDDFDAETRRTVRMSASLACTGRFTSMAQLLLGIKSVHSAAVSGLIVQTVSILLGIGLSTLLILSKAFAVRYAYISAAALVIYNLFFTVLTYLIVSLKRN